MNDLIKVTNDENGNQAVSARDLHNFLVKQAKGGQKGQDFSHWIKKMLDCGLIEGEDYIIEKYDYQGNAISGESDNQRVRRIEYILSLDAAKSISMLQRNDKGDEARRYFIEVEKKFQQVGSLSLLDLMEMSIKEMRKQDKRIKEVESRIDQVEAKMKTRPDYFTIAGYWSLNKKSIGIREAAVAGRRASKLCREQNITIERVTDIRYGQVGSYPRDILKQVFNDFQIASQAAGN